MEEILPRLYRIQVPLPGSPLKSVNSYVIKGENYGKIGEEGRNLIIDTGMNRQECKEALEEGLKELNIDLHRTDLFITHMHADHLGLVNEVATETSKIYFNYPDMQFMVEDIWDKMGQVATQSGFPPDALYKALKRHPGNRYSPTSDIDFTFLKEGDVLRVGGYKFQCLETPGHTPGSICLYEPEWKVIITGDHVLGDITPNISMWLDGRDPLGHYLDSLDKIYDLPVELVLPGHRRIFSDLQARIRELKEHHHQRIREVMEIIDEKGMDAYQIASYMDWDIQARSWAEFPVAQQWFAAGEARAHLRHMEEKGLVKSFPKGEKILYLPADKCCR